MQIYKRKTGEEQPFWRVGPFKVRLPFVHYRWETVETFQALIVVVVSLSMVPLLQQYLGVPYEVGLAYVMICGLSLLLPALLGSPLVPGWITPALPLVLLFIGDFEPGPEAIKALFAVQIIVFFIFFFLGITKLGELLIRWVPNSVQGGIIIGAGIAAVAGELEEGGRLMSTPISISVAVSISIFLLFSAAGTKWREKYAWVKKVTNYGILPGMAAGVTIAWIIGEYPLPVIEWGITKPDFVGLWSYLPFSVGLPEWSVIALAVPTALVAYVIAFGDIVVGRALMARADLARSDEKIDYSATRVHLITALRNLVHAFFAPYPGLAGPLFTAGMATIAERYRYGSKAMDSIFSGTGTLMLAAFAGLFFLPLVSVFKPILPIALSLSLLITGFVCLMVGMDGLRNSSERAVAGCMAVVLATWGAGWGLVAGLLLYLLVERANFFGREEQEDAAPEAAKPTTASGLSE